MVVRRSRFTEEEIVSIVKEWQTGASAKDLCDRYGISRNAFWHWTSRYGTQNQAKHQEIVLPSAEESLLHPRSAGGKLRQVRQDLGINVFQIVKESQRLAARYHNRHLVVWSTTLHSIEAGVHLPTVYQLYALSVIYGRSVNDIFSYYGIGW
jgi:putative transposase